MQAADEYNARPRGKPCWVCGIPEREELERAKDAGVGPSAMQHWLINDCGYSKEIVTTNRLAGHFAKNKHYEPPS